MEITFLAITVGSLWVAGEIWRNSSEGTQGSGRKEAPYSSTLLQRGRREMQGKHRGADEMRLCTPLLFYREAVGRYRRDVGGDIEEWT